MRSVFMEKWDDKCVCGGRWEWDEKCVCEEGVRWEVCME
jgi:hypothetical protein